MLLTKFHAYLAIELRVITIDTQMASGHLRIFAIYLHIETGISKSFKLLAIIVSTLHGVVLPMICAKKLLIFEEAKYLKMHFSTLTLKSQRSFRGHYTFMT